uniref:PWWP domain-containing protein n=1 Tax=Parastrongyloides trichosuri TaxID=131310 RepID=A0A0N4Z241_PARTI
MVFGNKTEEKNDFKKIKTAEENNLIKNNVEMEPSNINGKMLKNSIKNVQPSNSPKNDHNKPSSLKKHYDHYRGSKKLKDKSKRIKDFKVPPKLYAQLKKKYESAELSKTKPDVKEKDNIFQAQFPKSRGSQKDEVLTRRNSDIENCNVKKKSVTRETISNKKSSYIETCLEFSTLKSALPPVNKRSQEKADLSKKGTAVKNNSNKKPHRYAQIKCKEEFEKLKKPYMTTTNKNNNWQIYDEFGNPWWAKYKIGPQSKLIYPLKKDLDEDTTDDKLAINTQAILDVKEKRINFVEPEDDEEGFNDVFGPLRDLALRNDIQYGKTRIWWISLNNVIQMNSQIPDTQYGDMKTAEGSDCKKLGTFNEKDPITFVKYIKGVPKKQKVVQQVMKQIPIRKKNV